MVKKELAATANCSVGWSYGREADSIQSVEIEVHCDASVFDDHLLKRPGSAPGSGQLFVVPPKAFGALAGGEAKSKNNGSARPVSVNFDISGGVLWLW